MKYGIAAVVGLAILGGVGAWFYTREDEAEAGTTEAPVQDEAEAEPTEEHSI